MRWEAGEENMKLTYRQFLKTPIDLSPLGILPVENFQPYFCTPKGARVFGCSGVDGIHFCFVRGFGETVFAVSPMNGREGCVHPAAKTFRDFLRLLLALHDAAAIEQAWQWNAAQLEDFEQKHPSSDAQRAVLEIIAGTFGLRPMAEPWKYIHTVQAGFDYGKLRFSEEFYDDDRTANASDAVWKVTFEGGFWSTKGRTGKPISFDKTFSWAGDEWLVPAAYVCREGIVLGAQEEKRVRLHYKLDELDGWNIWRISFPWEGKKETRPRTLSLHLRESPVHIPGPEFTPEKAGDSITFRLPEKQQTYTLTALEIQVETLSAFDQTLYTTELAYTIAPEPPEESITLRDFAEPAQLSAQGGHSGCSFGVIGGADGPTVLAMGKDIVCSQVRQEEKRRVTWTLMFRKKRKEDLQIMLLGEKEDKKQ